MYGCPTLVSSFLDSCPHRSSQRELSRPTCVNMSYHEAKIKLERTQKVVEDLGKCHDCLDRALMKFHAFKLAEINKIIRDLWTIACKGEDVSRIKIVLGQESESQTKRSCNYRVVMSKGSTDLDMREKCSAGQRVLASVVIRLALADAFCLNFGCIALDEPTVNLDLKNRKGLAAALANIIGSRANQSNFQLILITHDKAFVLMMKEALSSQSTSVEMPGKYFEVLHKEGTDGKFYSKIVSRDWEMLY
jgi:DNA repair protein RAD50